MEMLVVVVGVAETTPASITAFKTARSTWATTTALERGSGPWP